MTRHNQGTSFDPCELSDLEHAQVLACEELGLTEGDRDQQRRRQVAKLIVNLAEEGEHDPDVLKSRAVARMRIID